MLAAIEQKLLSAGIHSSELSELLVRLLDHGVICRDESGIEQQLYDRYVRLESLVEDYFSLMGIRLIRNRDFHYIRLYPPGAEIPGVDDGNLTGVNNGLRLRLNQHEVALILVCRLQYDQALREGKLDDSGNVLVPMESLSLNLKNLLKRSLPEGITERRNLLRRIRQLRLISFNADADQESEFMVKIRPMITSFVSQEVLDQLSELTDQTGQNLEDDSVELSDSSADLTDLSSSTES